jgi:hypothetical protein
MSEVVQRRRQRYTDPYSALLNNHRDEDAWYDLFGENLRHRVCTVIVRERGIASYYSNGRNYRTRTTVRRQCLAYC